MFKGFFRKKKAISQNPISVYVYSIFGFYPDNEERFQRAFTHKSVESLIGNNERLEFLGDTILDTIIAEYLFHLYPNLKEGELTKLKSRIVSREQLNRIGKELCVLDHVFYIKGNNEYKSLEGNVIEALVGAIYLEKGYSFTKRLVVKEIVEKHIDLEKLKSTDNDYKSRVLAWSQKKKIKVKFVHSQTNTQPFKYLAKLFVEGIEESQATGDTKKKAEKEAARLYLKKQPKNWDN